MNRKIYIFLLLLLFSINTGAQTATRVVAFARFRGDTTLPCTDSGGYKYSNGRGGAIYYTPSSDFGCNNPFVFVPRYDFESGYNGLTNFDSAWEISPTDTDISVQFFDSYDNITYAQCNMFKGGIWQKFQSQSYSYDINQNLVQFTDSGSYSRKWIADALYKYAYDQNNRLIQLFSFSGRELGSWIFIDTCHYYYDSAGLLTKTIGLNTEIRGNNLYDSTNSIKTISNINGVRDSFVYSDSVRHQRFASIESAKYYFSANGDTMIVNYNPKDQFKRRSTVFDSHGNPIVQTQEILDTMLIQAGSTSYKKTWSYNSNNQVTCERDYLRDSTGNWTFTNLIRYYYESYTPAAPFVINTISVFPSPANNSVTIKLEWDKAQAFALGVFDVAGRLVSEWSEPAMQKYEKTMSLAELPPGHYFVKAVSGKQVLVNRFVVLH